MPFLDEEEHLPATLASLERQDRRPDRLVLVDDGSGDRSGAIADDFAAAHDWVRAVHRPRKPPSRDRLATAGEWVAFTETVAALEEPWDVVAKLDADLDLPPCAIAHLLERLAGDDRLGLAGCYLREATPEGPTARLQIPETHVHGATKFYRRACWEQIAPIPPILGWDTIDEVAAEVAGWRVRTFALPCGDPLHLRPRASHDGRLRGIRRFGECAYAFGEPAPIALLQAARQMREPPRMLGGANYALGWATAAARRRPRAAPELRAHVRRTQWRKIALRLGRGRWTNVG